MGQGLSCGVSHEHGLFSAVQVGDLESVESLLARDPSLLHQTTVYDRHSALHIAAANGQIEVVFSVFLDFLVGISACLRSSPISVVIWCFIYSLILGFVAVVLQILSMILDRSISPDLLNRNKQVSFLFSCNVCLYVWNLLYVEMLDLVVCFLFSFFFLLFNLVLQFSSLYCLLILLFVTDTDSAYACCNARKDFMCPKAPSSRRQCVWNSHIFLYFLIFFQKREWQIEDGNLENFSGFDVWFDAW